MFTDGGFVNKVLLDGGFDEPIDDPSLRPGRDKERMRRQLSDIRDGRIQDHYLRKVIGTENKYQGVAVKALDDDPQQIALCKMPA